MEMMYLHPQECRQTRPCVKKKKVSNIVRNTVSALEWSTAFVTPNGNTITDGYGKLQRSSNAKSLNVKTVCCKYVKRCDYKKIMLTDC